MISLLKITKGNNSAKPVGGVTIFNFCQSSSHALYLCQVCEIISNGMKVIKGTRILH